MRLGRALRRSGLLLSLFALMPQSRSLAAGFYQQDQSAVASGRAFSGEAADQGVDSLWWNPAAIGGLKANELAGNITGFSVWSKAFDQGTTLQRFGQTLPVGGSPSSSGVVENGLLPSGGLAVRLDDAWSVGLSVTSPFDFTTQYDTGSWVRYGALTSRLQVIDIQPTLAWRPVAWLSIGAGPNIEHTITALSRAVPNLGPALPDGTQTVHAEGWDAGYNVGVQLHLLDERLVLGAAYRSRVEHTLSGSLETAGLLGPLGRVDGRADDALEGFTTPWTMTFAGRFRVTRRLTLEAQVVHTGWGVFDNLVLLRPAPIQFAENYSDTTSGAIGADYAVSPAWTLRAGVQYDPSPVNPNAAEGSVPDGDRWLLSLGTSIEMRRGWFLDAGASYLDVASSHINRDQLIYPGTPVASLLRLRGQFQASGFVFALGSRLRF